MFSQGPSIQKNKNVLKKFVNQVGFQKEINEVYNHYVLYFKAKNAKMKIIDYIFSSNYSLNYLTNGEHFIKSMYVKYGQDEEKLLSILNAAYTIGNLNLIKYITKPITNILKNRSIYPYVILYSNIKKFVKYNSRFIINLNAEEDDFDF